MPGPPYLQVDDYEPVAKSKLPADVYDFYAGGAGDERTLAENVRAFDRWLLRPRVLRGVGTADPSTTILGSRIAMPVLVAPWAFQRRAHPDGELATVRATARAGTIAVISSTAADHLEAIAAAGAGHPSWWQLYLYADVGRSAELIQRVVASGFAAICWTVDLPVLGIRHRDTRSGSTVPVGLDQEELEYESALTWDHLGFIRDHAPGLPVLVKGILTAEDAVLAVEHGADGLVVSNHGGRQLDGVAPTLRVLPEVLAAVDAQVEVLLDSGIRRGSDIVKALCLGARAVLVGRAYAYGLGAAGVAGVTRAIEILREDVVRTMKLLGCSSVQELDRSFVEVPAEW